METVTMSYEELDRVSRVQQVIDGRLAQRAAGTMLGLTSRQVRRLCRAYETHGPAGLASKRRGRPSNRRLAEALRREALELVRARYEGFGPTLAHEKLTEIHNLDISVETLRHWMSEDGLWVPRARRQPRIQQPRRRRPCRGELIQIDGCDHEWFEDRGPRCTALVFVDDATTALMGLLFCESESAFSYFTATREYLEQHGRPVALYSDKAGVFHAEEHEDGAISFWFGGLELPATAFPNEHAVRPVEVVENKRLNAALEFMRVQQKRRVDAQVAKTSTTRRDARLLREGTQRRTTPPAGP
jgi:transposase